MPAALKSPAKFTVERVSVFPGEIELGETSRAVIAARNIGELAGSAIIAVTLDGAPVSSGALTLEPGATGETTVDLQPTRGGNVPIRANVDGSSGSAYLRVKAPQLVATAWDYEDLWCEDEVPFQLALRNDGDGIARDVVVTATSYNENNVAQDTQSVTVGSISAGTSNTAGLSLFARDTCGRDDYFYVSYTITPTHGEAVRGTTPRFSI